MLKIKETAKQKGVSINELADRIGISRITLHSQMNGNPTIDTLNKIANALNVPITELFESPNTEETIGIIRHNGKNYEINSIEDIKKLLEDIEK